MRIPIVAGQNAAVIVTGSKVISPSRLSRHSRAAAGRGSPDGKSLAIRRPNLLLYIASVQLPHEVVI